MLTFEEFVHKHVYATLAATGGGDRFQMVVNLEMFGKPCWMDNDQWFKIEQERIALIGR